MGWKIFSVRLSYERYKFKNDGQVYCPYEKKSNEERLKMGCSMFDFAKQIVRDSITGKCSNLNSSEMNKELFIRFYSEDISEPKKLFILNSMDMTR